MIEGTIHKRENSYVIDTDFGPKTREVIEDDPLWTECVRIEQEEGFRVLPEPPPLGMVHDENGLRAMTDTERVASGLSSVQEINEIRTAEWRIAIRQRFASETDPLVMQAILGEIDADGVAYTLERALAAKAQIRQELPKPTPLSES